MKALASVNLPVLTRDDERFTAARTHHVAFEDLTGSEGKSYWKRLLAFVGARDLAAPLETSLVRLGNATARRFANEEVVVEALRGAGC